MTSPWDPRKREADQLIYGTLHRFRGSFGADSGNMDELRGVAAEAIARARTEWNGKGEFGPFAFQRASWKIQDTLRKLARRHTLGVTREHLLATAAATGVCLAAEAGPPLDLAAIPDLFRAGAAAFDVEMDSAPPLAENDGAEDVELMERALHGCCLRARQAGPGAGESPWCQWTRYAGIGRGY